MWLKQNIYDIGVVKLGGHLYTQDGRSLNYDFFRYPLPREVFPGEVLEIDCSLALPQKGDYLLTFDLVSEHICWFELQGSKPLQIEVLVSDL